MGKPTPYGKRISSESLKGSLLLHAPAPITTTIPTLHSLLKTYRNNTVLSLWQLPNHERPTRGATATDTFRGFKLAIQQCRLLLFKDILWPCKFLDAMKLGKDIRSTPLSLEHISSQHSRLFLGILAQAWLSALWSSTPPTISLANSSLVPALKAYTICSLDYLQRRILTPDCGNRRQLFACMYVQWGGRLKP